MKFMRFMVFCCMLLPGVSFGASSVEFQKSVNLLTAARRGDIQTVQMLIESGANVNYVDATGMSLVCTAVMNNDKRAIQILQMYGADASNCDKQIKKYKQKSRTATSGEDYGFFSGLSSPQVILLSAAGVVAVVGGVAWLTNALDGKSNNNGNTPSGGSHSGGGESGGGSGGGGSSGSTPTKYFTVPNSPSSLNSDFNEETALADFIEAEKKYFKYVRVGTAGNFISDGVNKYLQNYLLIMGGYHSLVNGYMGQETFRSASNNYAPIIAAYSDSAGVPFQGTPITVALVTGNGINPAGSADPSTGIGYMLAPENNKTEVASKYFNTSVNDNVETEIKTNFDLSGSGSAFNPFANVNDSALAKIVAGWEAGGESSLGDLYGFVPNAQLAILRTGNGNVWKDVPSLGDPVGTWSQPGSALAAGGVVTIGGYKYNIVKAIAETTITNPTITIGDSSNLTTYKLSTNSNLFLGQCIESSGCTGDIAIYVGMDGYWYVNSTGGNDIDAVYSVNNLGNIYVQKTRPTEDDDIVYYNFEALRQAKLSTEIDVIANVNILDVSRNLDYLTVKNFAAATASISDKSAVYRGLIDLYYGEGQGVAANEVLGGLSQTSPDSNVRGPMLIMPAGEYVNTSGTVYIPLDATFENYAPLVYPTSLNHNFMTVVAVSRQNGTTGADNVAEYETNTNATYGQITLSKWMDDDNNVYAARSCGIAGIGSGSVDPWCFAAAGPTTEMATASAAGAVASIKSAFPYMTNDQVFTLLALTADGPLLKINTEDNNNAFTKDSLKQYLVEMYNLPYEYDIDSLSPDEYFTAFNNVYGYGLINLERAITPSKTVSYYTKGKIVSSSGNAYWRAATTNVKSSKALSLNRQSIKTSYYDVVESSDGSLSMPRVYSNTFAFDNNSKSGLYMGDVLGEFNIDSNNKQHKQIGQMSFDMALSPKDYNDNLNGLDDLRIAFSNEKYDVAAQYQRHFTDGESRFYGRANGVLNLVSNSVASNANYKIGGLSFGGRAFMGDITDENLIETDPVISSQFAPGRLGFANGGEFNTGYNNDKVNLNVSFGMLNETNTVLGMMADGLLSINGANTQYVDMTAAYKLFDNVKLSLRGTFANTNANSSGEIITELSNIKSNAFAFGADVGGFSFTAAMPLAVVSGSMGYDYANFSVVENGGGYEVMLNNPHTEYIDLSAQKREMRLSASYKTAVGEFTDAGVGMIYRVNPGNTDMFGNESVLMFKLHHRLGI